MFDRNGQRTTRNILSETGYNVYHGKIVQYDHTKTIHTTAYSVIDMVSASGGLITGVYYSFIPIALTFSRLSFNLGVISLLFLARSSKAYDRDYKKWKECSMSLDRYRLTEYIQMQRFFKDPRGEQILCEFDRA